MKLEKMLNMLTENGYTYGFRMYCDQGGLGAGLVVRKSNEDEVLYNKVKTSPKDLVLDAIKTLGISYIEEKPGCIYVRGTFSTGYRPSNKEIKPRKARAIQFIRDITSGTGFNWRENTGPIVVSPMAEKVFNEGLFTYGMEYGAIIALCYILGITNEDFNNDQDLL